MYKCVASTIAGFVQQLAVAYVANGYYFYVSGWVPEGKDPAQIDEKLVARYGVDISKWTRARRKRAGIACVQYIRYDRVFVLLATEGEHDFRRAEAAVVRDVRRIPLRAFGYSVGVTGGRVQVRIARDVLRGLRARFLDIGVHRKAEFVTEELSRIPFEPYHPVRRQLVRLLRAVNRVRRKAGFDRIPAEAVRCRRRIVRPFGP